MLELFYNTLQKYYHTSPEAGLYQTENNLGYSTREAGSEVSPNAHNLAFINDSIAVMPRRSDDKAWIVDTSAQTEEDFKICELDLSAYSTQKTNEDSIKNSVKKINFLFTQIII